jgi:hypothetical protein
MPVVADTAISSVVGEPRERLSRHTFLGGNFFMLRMLNRFGGELGVVAPGDELNAAADATLRQLAEDTADVAITRADLAGGRLAIDVRVRNRTGHKLPTGYPSRRAWLHVVARDGRGQVIFESGAVSATGAIAGNDNDADAARFEPHYAGIRSPDQVQIYEAIMGEPDGSVTTGLLRATRYLKDNRLLPRGFDKGTAAAEIAVHGAAASDGDFTGDGDLVRYSIDASGATGPFAVEVTLRYQTIAYRWAENLRGYESFEPARFVRYWDAMKQASSAVLGRTATMVGTPQ